MGNTKRTCPVLIVYSLCLAPCTFADKTGLLHGGASASLFGLQSAQCFWHDSQQQNLGLKKRKKTGPIQYLKRWASRIDKLYTQRKNNPSYPFISASVFLSASVANDCQNYRPYYTYVITPVVWVYGSETCIGPHWGICWGVKKCMEYSKEGPYPLRRLWIFFFMFFTNLRANPWNGKAAYNDDEKNGGGGGGIL